MLKHFLITSLRNFRRNKSAAILNLLGLSIGLATVILILEYVVNEASFDRFHSNRNNIFRVIIKQEKDAAYSPTAFITAAVGPSMKEEFPEVNKFVRFVNPADAFFTYEEKNFPVKNLSYTDSTLFDVFSFKLLKGDPNKALTEPYQAILTETVARQIFGNEDPLFKVLRLNGQENIVITGVMKDFPSNSHLNFGALVSFSSLYQDKNLYLDWNGGWNYYTYVLLNEKTDLAALKQKFPGFMEKNINYIYRPSGFVLHLDLQPLTRVYLFSGKDSGIEEEGDLQSLYIFSSIALFILVVACINFVNLTTALSFMRSREIGLRKVSGASRKSIILQFLSETLIYSILAFLSAIVLVEVLQPAFNRLIGKELSLFGISGLKMTAGLIFLIIITSLMAGSYPAWFISRFPPLLSIRGTIISGKGKSVFRNILVVFQFLVSVVLIVMTLGVYKQMHYLNKMPLGYDGKNVVIIPLLSENTMKNYQVLKDAFLGISSVQTTGASSEIPGDGFTMNGYLPEGYKEPVMIHVLDVDADYFDVMKIPVIQGRNFDKTTNADSSSFLINETLAKQLGWDEPVGKTIYREGPHKVIGVVADFHFSSLYQAVQPLILTKQPWIGYNYLSVRLVPGNREQAIQSIKSAWNTIIPDEPFDYFPHEVYVSNSYTGVRNAGKTILWFSFLAVFIACLGLLGLANYTFNLRKKEIGIRKVLGAESNAIAGKVALEFLRLVIIAGILAIPLAWWLLDIWLNDFAFKTYIGPWIFIFPIIFVTILAWLTIYFQVKNLANTNPVDVLKFE